jgi:1-acyl-sn-glycerol-3-phosphate acyltransferase
MEERQISKDRLEILQRIEEYERTGQFDKDVENDPPAPELLPEKVDYLCKKNSSKIARKIANAIGDKYFLNLIKKGNLIIDGVVGEEYLSALQNGAIVTCNHFSVCDNYIVFHCLRKYLPKKYLYKIIREGNYTNFPGLFGFLMRHCNTLPLSSNRRTMINFMSAVNTLLENGESILIYPEQGMWWNYRKPRPMQEGAFNLAVRNNTPIVPIFIGMEDSDVLDGDGFFVQEYTLHILPAIYPNPNLSKSEAKEEMKNKNYNAWVKAYEEFYNKPLEYGEV